MSIKNKLFVGCGSIIGFFVIIFIGVIVYSAVNKNSYDKEIVPLTQEMLPVLATWDHNKFKEYLAPQFIEVLSEEELENMFSMFSRLGNLIDHEKPNFMGIHFTSNNPYGKEIRYSIPAKYKNGEAQLNLVFVPIRENSLKIWHIHINSPVFIVPNNNEQPH